MEIRAGTLTALYLFDVAESIDLARLRAAMGGGADARVPSKTSAPAYLDYQTPPLVIEGDAAGVAPIDGFGVRLKFFDYGVVSLALSRRVTGSWSDLVALGPEYIESPALEAQAESIVRAIIQRCKDAMTKTRSSWLSEDYLVVAVHDADDQPSAEALLATSLPCLASSASADG